MGSGTEHDLENPVKDASTVKEMGDEVRLATDLEHRMTFLEGLKLYPAAVGWSMFFSIGIIMCAFDPQLLGSLYATPAFQKDFGYLFEDSYIISAPWQSGLGMGSPVGQVVGALAAGYPMDWYGRKKVRHFYVSRPQFTDIARRSSHVL
jgi:MFS transporter, SP family, general alpha glucoside:H+ symporter